MVNIVAVAVVVRTFVVAVAAVVVVAVLVHSIEAGVTSAVVDTTIKSIESNLTCAAVIDELDAKWCLRNPADANRIAFASLVHKHRYSVSDKCDVNVLRLVQPTLNHHMIERTNDHRRHNSKTTNKMRQQNRRTNELKQMNDYHSHLWHPC